MTVSNWHTRPCVVYSRVSSSQQHIGRQTSKVQQLIQQYSITNVEYINDDGVSAYSGAHISSGNLGQLLSRNDIGMLTIIVENLDRLSRQHLMIAVNQFTSLINSGACVVTVSPFAVYDRSSDFGDVLMAVISMSRAYEESLIKSQRIIEGQSRARANGKRWVLARYEYDEHYAQRVRLLFNYVLNGYSIVESSRKCGLSANEAHYVLRSKRVLGISKRHDIAGPALIDVDVWERVQRIIGPRRKRGRAARNTISHLIKCALCGAQFHYNAAHGRCRYDLFRSSCKCGSIIHVDLFVLLLVGRCIRLDISVERVSVIDSDRVIAAKAKVERLRKALLTVDDVSIAALYVEAQRELHDLEQTVRETTYVVRPSDIGSLVESCDVVVMQERYGHNMYRYVGHAVLTYVDGNVERIRFENTTEGFALNRAYEVTVVS